MPGTASCYRQRQASTALGHPPRMYFYAPSVVCTVPLLSEFGSLVLCCLCADMSVHISARASRYMRPVCLYSLWFRDLCVHAQCECTSLENSECRLAQEGKPTQASIANQSPGVNALACLPAPSKSPEICEIAPENPTQS